jgi:glycosyltransferase involved in cell wall biosynthesis
MKLLFLTQTLDADDAVLGFTTRWVEGLSKHVEEVRAVALEVGRTDDLPANVSWREIGRRGKLGRWLRYRKVLNEAFAEGYDAVLAHIVPRYASLAAAPARRAGAKLFLWYTHGAVDARLRKAESEVLKVFTATEESLCLETPKKVVTGHGVDVANFAPRGASPDSPPRILAVGRISPAKDPLTLLAAVSILRSRGRELHLDLVGAGLLSADDSLRRQVEDQIELGGLSGCVSMPGAVGYSDIAAWYRRATVVVNSSGTGSLDKVVIEAMASERPVLSCNPSAAGVLRELGRAGDALVFEKGSAEDLASKLEGVLDQSAGERSALGSRLRALAERDHEVDALMARLVKEMGG